MFPIAIQLMDILRGSEPRDRPVLQDITRTPSTRRAVYSESNISQLEYYFASPEELIIQERSRDQMNLSTSLCLYPHDEREALDGDFLLATPEKFDSLTGLPRKRLRLSSPDVPRTKCLSTPTKRRNEELQVSSSFAEELEAFSRDQLVSTLHRLITAHPELETEVKESLKSPDLKPFEDRLAFIQRVIYRLLPSSRWDTGRGSYSFRKVKVPLTLFKRTCADQLRTLVRLESWDSVVRYVVMAWKYISKLPNWEDPQHNRIRIGCYSLLASTCSQAIRSGNFSRQQLVEMQEKLQRCRRLNELIAPSLRVIDKLLQESV